jgi:hypothetical protein
MESENTLTAVERMRRIKLIGLIAALALPYCFWVGSDYSDRIEPWIGLVIFVGYLNLCQSGRAHPVEADA